MSPNKIKRLKVKRVKRRLVIPLAVDIFYRIPIQKFLSQFIDHGYRKIILMSTGLARSLNANTAATVEF